MTVTVGTADRFVLAIDQGTSATKAVLVDERGIIRDRVTVPVSQSHPRPGWAEQDAMEIWSSVQTAVRQLLEYAGDVQVVAVGLSTQRESTLLWDRETGEPVGPMLGWQDNRGADLCARLRRDGYADRVQDITGLPLDGMFSASKASALLDVHDPDRTRAHAGQLCLGTMDSWLIWRLTSRHLIEAGNASRTLLLDIATSTWDSFLLDLFNVPREVMPTVVASTGPFATCTGLDPLPSSTPVTGVMGDSHAALFAHAGWHPGQVKATYGTGSSVMGVVPGDAAHVTGVAKTIAWATDSTTYALEGNIRSTGHTLAWLARILGSTPAQIADLAADTSDGVVIVPAFSGLGAPWWNERARGLITGLSDATRPEHLARAAVEAIAFQVEDVVTAIEPGLGHVATILADGGPSANATLMQLQADISGRSVATSDVSELSALGAAHMAGLGAGLWSVTDLEQLPRGHATYQPGDYTPSLRTQHTAWTRALNATLTIATSQEATA